MSMSTFSVCLRHKLLLIMWDLSRAQHHALTCIDEGIIALSCIEGRLATEAKLGRLHRRRVHIVIHRHRIAVPLVEARGSGVARVVGGRRNRL